MFPVISIDVGNDIGFYLEKWMVVATSTCLIRLCTFLVL